MKNYVLIVDDNKSDQLLARALVEKEDMKTILVNDGHEAIEQMHEADIGLFIIDLQMPKMSGMDLLKRVRRIQKFDNTPILIMSARNQAKDVKSALDCGASDYIVKPLDHMIFENKLKLLTDKNDKWAEYRVDTDKEHHLAFVEKDVQMVTINEVSVRLVSNFPLLLNEKVNVGGKLFEELGLPPAMVRVVHCEKSGSHYVIRADFIGTNETQRTMIRTYCIRAGKEKVNG